MDNNICNVCGANYAFNNDIWICPVCGNLKPLEDTKEASALNSLAGVLNSLATEKAAEAARIAKEKDETEKARIAANKECEKLLEFALTSDRNGYMITDVKDRSLTTLHIPTQYNGLPVVAIDDNAFIVCSELTSITIPNSVTSIGQMAFARCRGLTSITIPNSVTSIGYSAFSGCSGLTSITIPSSVTSIGWAAFSDCSGLTSISIPNSVTSIGIRAFGGCGELASITIPNSVTSMGWYAFEGFGKGQIIIVKGGKAAAKMWDGRWKKHCKAKIVYE